MSRLRDPQPTEPRDQENDMTSPTQRRHDELVALLTEIRDRLPEPEGVNESIPTRERPPERDLAEAVWHRQFEKEKARAEKAEAERDVLEVIADGLSSKATEWKNRATKAEADVRKARDERDDAIARAESWRDANSGIHAERDAALDEVVRLRVSVEAAEDERDEWKAKHAALREAVEFEAVDHGTSSLRRCLNRILDHDDERAKGERR